MKARGPKRDKKYIKCPSKERQPCFGIAKSFKTTMGTTIKSFDSKAEKRARRPEPSMATPKIFKRQKSGKGSTYGGIPELGDDWRERGKGW